MHRTLCLPKQRSMITWNNATGNPHLVDKIEQTESVLKYEGEKINARPPIITSLTECPSLAASG